MNGDLARAVEYCVSGGQVPPPAQPTVIEMSQPCTQAPALPFARASPRRGRSEDSFTWPDSAEDRLRAAQEAAAFADELHEDAVAAAIADCERMHDEAPLKPSPAAPCATSEAFEEALQAAWERYREVVPAKQSSEAAELPASLQPSPAFASQTQPEPPRGGRRAGSGPSARAPGRPRAGAAAAAAAAAAAKAASKLAEEEPGPSANVQFFDGPLSLPCAGLSQATQPEEPILPRGGRRAGSPPRARSGRARALPASAPESQGCLKQEDDEASVKEEEGVKEEDGEEDADLFGGAPGVAEATQAPRRGSSEVGSQLESLLAAAIDVPDDLDLDGLPATGKSGGHEDSGDEIGVSPSLRAPWDEEGASQVPAGDNTVSQICASPLLPWEGSSLPGGVLDTQGATAWEPSAMY